MVTQKEKILRRIKQVGYVDSFWALRNYILRLASRMNDLKNDGLNIRGVDGKALGKRKQNHKNYYYFIKR